MGWASIACKGRSILRCSVDYSTGCESGFEAELRGFVTASQIAKDLGCESAQFLSDCTDVFWALQSGHGGSEGVAATFEEGVTLLRNKPVWKIFHVFRDGNAISDWLAKKTRSDRWSWGCQNAIPMLPFSVFGLVI